MYNDLIVMTFSSKHDALFALFGLDISREKEILGLETVTVLGIEGSGKATITQVWDARQYPHNLEGRVPGELARLLCADLNHKDLVEAGLDAHFLEQVQHDLTPNSSAVLHYIPRESVIDTERLLDIMSHLRGKLYHTTFPAAVENMILKGTAPYMNAPLSPGA